MRAGSSHFGAESLISLRAARALKAHARTRKMSSSGGASPFSGASLISRVIHCCSPKTNEWDALI
jgi:hypothetical protein